MREIKFRGWDAETKQMWGWFELMNTHPLGCLYTHHDLSWVVMQYTGQTDKNGNQIYEGDILKYTTYANSHEIKTGKVEFVDEQGGYKLINKKYGVEHAFDKFICCDSEIIGNIYENPELMEVAE